MSKAKQMEVDFIPAEGKVLMRTVAPKSKSGIIGAEKKDDEEPTQKGLIFATGSDKHAVGDVVMYNKFAAVPVKLKEGNFLLSSIEAILGTVTA